MEEKLSAHSTISVSATCSIKSLTPLSRTHIICAYLCAKGCRELEQEYIGGNSTRDENDLFQEDMAYADGAIMASVAFLESTINEFLHDLKINQSAWKDLNLEGKYKFVYKKILNDELDEKSAIYVDFVDLIYVRNRLIHFKLKWQTTDPEEDDQYDLRRRLENKFKKNPFRESTGNPYFPDKCLGAACAKWSINVSIKFLIMLSNDLSKSGIDLLKPHIVKIIQKYSS
jgi:hypothetical protein